MLHNQTKLKLHQSACYRICVQGILDKNWEAIFSGLTITSTPGGSYLDADPGSYLRTQVAPVTILTGQMIDQAMLLGVLNHLYGLGLCLLGVEWLAEGDSFSVHDA